MKKVYLLGFLLAASAAHSPAFSMVEAGGGVVAAPVAGAIGVATPQAGCPKPFQGFFLGANIGYDVATGKHKIFTNNGGEDDDGEDDNSLFSNRIGPNGVDGGVSVGYRHRWCNWLAGIGFDANWANTEAKSHVNNGFHSKIRLKNSLDLYAVFGYVMREIAMPYIKLGWENAEWKQRVDFQGDTFNRKKRVNQFLWGVGVEFLATRHTSVGFEYTGTAGGKLKRHADGLESSWKPQNNKFAFVFKFIY